MSEGQGFDAEQMKRQQLKEKRDRLESERKSILEEAEAAKESQDFMRASQLYFKAAEISQQLAEKGNMRTFRALSEEMQKLEKERQEKSQLGEIRDKAIVVRRKVLADAERLMLEGKFREASVQYQEAAKISADMKDHESEKEYLAFAKDIVDKEMEYIKKWQANRDRNEKEAALVKVSSEAEKFLETPGQEEKAADMYVEAAKIARDLGNKELAQSYLDRAKEIREIKNEIERRQKEEEEKKKLETKRSFLEKKRFASTTEAEHFMEKGNFKKAAECYHIAGEASQQLGDKAISQEYFATAKKILENRADYEREFKKKKRLEPLRNDRRRIVAMAKQKLEYEEYVEAARLYREAATLSSRMGEDSKVRELSAKVQEAMKMERGRKEEVIDRVMKAFKAIITLRKMEPEVAVSMYEWAADSNLGRKQVVVKIWDVGAITLKFEKGKSEILSMEAKKNVSILLQGTAGSIMAVAQGKLSYTWAWLTGRIAVKGSNYDINQFLKLMIIPMLEKEKDAQNQYSTKIGIWSILFTSVYITYIPILPDPNTPDRFKPIVDVTKWGNKLLDWTFGRIAYIGPLLTRTIHPWVMANILLFPTFYIVVSSALDYLTINRHRVKNAKERLRSKRREAMEQAERMSAQRDIPQSIHYYERSIRYALEAGEDETAKELAAKVEELIKLLPKSTGKKKKKKGKGKGGKGGKTRGQAGISREEAKEQTMKLQEEMNECVKKAEQALGNQDFTGAADWYAKAAAAAKNIGDRERIIQFQTQAEELYKYAKKQK